MTNRILSILLLVPCLLPADTLLPADYSNFSNFSNFSHNWSSPGAILSHAGHLLGAGSNNPGGVFPGEMTSWTSPGWILADWNPIPSVAVQLQGIPDFDDYPRDYSPGALLTDNADDFQFSPPNLLLSGAIRSNAQRLVAVGVDPEPFVNSPPNVSSPRAALASTALLMLTSASEDGLTPPNSPSVRSTSLAGGISASALGVPEPGTAGALLFGLSLIGWKLRFKSASSKNLNVN